MALSLRVPEPQGRDAVYGVQPTQTERVTPVTLRDLSRDARTDNERVTAALAPYYCACCNAAHFVGVPEFTRV